MQAGESATTLIENAGKLLVAEPSDTLITIPPCSPTSADVGVPLNVPLDESNVVHSGLPEMLKVSGSLSASEAVGVNSYKVLAVTTSGGVPDIEGRELLTTP